MVYLVEPLWGTSLTKLSQNELGNLFPKVDQAKQDNYSINKSSFTFACYVKSLLF